jgi:hypothetical protein
MLTCSQMQSRLGILSMCSRRPSNRLIPALPRWHGMVVAAAAVVATVAIAAVVEAVAVGVTERKLGGSQLTIRDQVDLEV